MKMRLCGMVFLLAIVLRTSAQDAPDKLSLSNFNEVRGFVIGDTAEPEYFKVDWKDNVLDGVMDARAQDKPILLWLYFGGPFGNC